MEEFIFRNYMYYNLREILFRIHRLHPEVIDDDRLKKELAELGDYVSKLKFDKKEDKKKEIEDKEQSVKSATKEKKTTRKKREVTPINVDGLQITFNKETLLSLNKAPNNTVTVINYTDKDNYKCMARVVSSVTNGQKLTDYVSVDSVTNKTVYGRRCLNSKMLNDPTFCNVHKKKNDYGLFTDEPTDAIKELCQRKYDKLKNTSS